MARSKPRLLDLFCGAGGCAVGYHRAGFEVVGVDIRPQPRYPFPFVEGDALDFLRCLGAGASACGYYLSDFAAIHASPPCQAYSVTRSINGRPDLPDLLPETRRLLIATGKPWVIENVPGAPMNFAALVCGLSLGLRVKRHRLFESSVWLFGTGCPATHGDNVIVFGHEALFADKSWVSVYGGGAPAKPDGSRRASADVARIAMGIDWMTRDELSQAIPPAYTHYLGKQLMRAIGHEPEGTE